jgi:hypothetical protein
MLVVESKQGLPTVLCGCPPMLLISLRSEEAHAARSKRVSPCERASRPKARAARLFGGAELSAD